MAIELGRLSPIALRDIWEDEAIDFTPWLAEAENLALLGETLGMELELEAQEIHVGDFRADILCRDTVDNSRVLIENQLERTDHDHLGKILTYSAGLNVRTVIWIAREFRDEHLAALEWQNEMTDERFQCFGIEVKLWKIEDSICAPQFDIVSKPNDWSPTVIQATQRATSEALSETQAQQEQFWTQLRDAMVEKGSRVRCPKPVWGNFLVFSIGRTDFSMEAWQASQNKEIGIRLYMRGQDATAHFYLLKEQQAEIEEAFGEPLEWAELPGRKSCRISLRKGDTDPTDVSDWPKQHEWLADKLERFNTVFRPRIQALDAANYNPLADADDG